MNALDYNDKRERNELWNLPNMPQPGLDFFTQQMQKKIADSPEVQEAMEKVASVKPEQVRLWTKPSSFNPDKAAEYLYNIFQKKNIFSNFIDQTGQSASSMFDPYSFLTSPEADSRVRLGILADTAVIYGSRDTVLEQDYLNMVNINRCQVLALAASKLIYESEPLVMTGKLNTQDVIQSVICSGLPTIAEIQARETQQKVIRMEQEQTNVLLSLGKWQNMKDTFDMAVKSETDKVMDTIAKGIRVNGQAYSMNDIPVSQEEFKELVNEGMIHLTVDRERLQTMSEDVMERLGMFNPGLQNYIQVSGDINPVMNCVVDTLTEYSKNQTLDADDFFCMLANKIYTYQKEEPVKSAGTDKEKVQSILDNAEARAKIQIEEKPHWEPASHDHKIGKDAR